MVLLAYRVLKLSILQLLFLFIVYKFLAILAGGRLN